MITFVITKGDVSNSFECTLEESISSLKNKIIQQFNLPCKYIDIDFLLERPIRRLGKFNLESGILPRTLDTYTFDRYGLEGLTVTATFHEVEDYEPKNMIKNSNTLTLSKSIRWDTVLPWRMFMILLRKQISQHWVNYKKYSPSSHTHLPFFLSLIRYHLSF